MKNHKSKYSRRQRRQRLVLQLLATMGVGIGTASAADLAYYAPHPADAAKQQVAAVSNEQSLTLVQAPTPAEAVPPAPLQDQQETFQGEQGDRFLPSDASPSDLDPPIMNDDINAIVDGAGTAAPAPFAAEQFEAPARNFNQGRQSLGATAASYSAAPNMIGDFGGLNLIGSLLGATIALAGGDRRFKVSENVSPIPQDRLFFNYNHFENSLVDINGDKTSLDRFTFGFEKTFLDGLASIETRVPFAGGLNSRQIAGDPDTEKTEFGNLAFALKGVLVSGSNWALTGGTTLSLPTGDDFELFAAANTPQLLVENDSVHLAPFLGYVAQPNNCWFVQGFLQADFDLNGNDVFTTANGFEGTLQDQNLLFLDASIGRWLHRGCDPCNGLSGVAAIAELHYTTTLNDTDGVAGISNPFNRMDILNATGALNFQFPRAALRVGAAAPITDDEERLFDAEIIVQLNRFY